MKIIFVLITTIAFSFSLSAQTADKSVEVSKTVLELIKNNKATEATSYFDETMKKQLPPETLNNIWNGLNKQLGGFISFGETSSGNYNEYRIVYIICNFQLDKLKYKAVINKANKVSGLFFIPVDKN